MVTDEAGVFYRKRAYAMARGVVIPLKKPWHAKAAPLDDAVAITIPIPIVPPRRTLPQLAPPVAIEQTEAPVSDPDAVAMEQAKALLRSAAYVEALDALAALDPTPEVTALRLRILANIDAPKAAQACAEAVMAHPLSVELNFLRAIFVTHMGQPQRGAETLRRVLYLDPSLAIGHFVLATLLQQQARVPEARRAYRNARDLCLARPGEDELPLAEGETAGRLAALADAQMDLLTN